MIVEKAEMLGIDIGISEALNTSLQLRPIGSNFDDVVIGSVVKGFIDPNSTRTRWWVKLHDFFDDLKLPAIKQALVVEVLSFFSDMTFQQVREALSQQELPVEIQENAGYVDILNQLLSPQWYSPSSV